MEDLLNESGVTRVAETHRTEQSQSTTVTDKCATALLPDGTTYRDAAKQMMSLHPGVGYWALGRTLGSGDPTDKCGETLAVDGRELSERDCYIEAIHCDPLYCYAYFNLGSTMTSTEVVTLKDGRQRWRHSRTRQFL